MANLIWCKYGRLDKQSNRLVVDLGIKGHLLFCLDNDKLGKEEITMLRQAATQIDKMTPDERVEWLKNRIPTAMVAFRTLKIEELVILNRYPLKPI